LTFTAFPYRAPYSFSSRASTLSSSSFDISRKFFWKNASQTEAGASFAGIAIAPSTAATPFIILRRDIRCA